MFLLCFYYINYVFYTSKMSIPAVGTTQPPKQGLGVLLCAGPEADHLPPSSAEVTNE